MDPFDDVPRVTDDTAVIDPALHARIVALVADLVSDDPVIREDAEAALMVIGAPAIEALLFAMSDARRPVADRARSGTLVGRIGDPRLAGPDFVGPMIRVTSGTFRMGAKPFEPDAETNALPQHDVDIASYAVARYPVTNQAFALFVADGGYDRPEWWGPEGWQWRQTAGITVPHYWRTPPVRPNHPVVGVSWFEAWAYCRWLSRRLDDRGDLRPGEEVRLPTEAEWEKAARGGATLDRRRAQPNNMPERRFPWGDAFVANLGNTTECGLGSTSPVGMFPEGSSPYKVDDLGGNVLEWCNSRPGAYPYHAGDGREVPTGGPRSFRVSRGGAWGLGADSARCAYRRWNHADFRGGTSGFRVVMAHPIE